MFYLHFECWKEIQISDLKWDDKRWDLFLMFNMNKQIENHFEKNFYLNIEPM